MVVVSESESENEFSVREFSVKQLFRKLTCRMVTHGDPSDKPYRACSAPLAPPIPPRAGAMNLLPSTSSPLYSACSHRTLHSPGSRLLARTHRRCPSVKAIAQNANRCRMTMLILDVLVLGWLESSCAEYQHHARPSKTWILESSSSEVSYVDGLKTFENISHAGNHSSTRRCGLVRWETGPGGVVMAIELRLPSLGLCIALAVREGCLVRPVY